MPQHSPSRAEAAKPPVRGPPVEAGAFSVVGVGASAGGLEACRKLLSALPADTGLAFILIQHLDPFHESLMVDLLASKTGMTVRQIADGMRIERDHVYVIPPGTYLHVSDGVLHLSQPQARHGARLPFDFFLHSLAEDYGSHAICIVLSGTGADGSLGLRSVHQKRGLVIAQDPDEASFDGMPRSAMKTGAVDLVLKVADMPSALARFQLHPGHARGPQMAITADNALAKLPDLIELLRARTPHDFRHYKPGTLKRRIERRMAMSAVETSDMGRYLDILKADQNELDLLAQDLLINVTSFFRDTKVFDALAATIVPELVDNQPADRTLRVWIAGCSTGEEAYSLAMLFRERIALATRAVKLQIFASDADPDAIAFAREGRYPASIQAEVSPERLARFFTKEVQTYRVLPELRTSIVFTIQDVLIDPPFSKLDMVSCRNLLIYLGSDAQAKVIARFHFALRNSGILLLGNSETTGTSDGGFEVISKSARLYRRMGRDRPLDLGTAMNTGDPMRIPARPGHEQVPSEQAALAEITRRAVLDSYAPATILIDQKHQCLHFLGPTDRYLQVARGTPTHDLLSMVPQALRSKLRSAIRQSVLDGKAMTVTGGESDRSGRVVPYDINVRPIALEAGARLLVSFLDKPSRGDKPARSVEPHDLGRVAELEQELDAVRLELQSAHRNLEISSDEQQAINEEALSVNEEFQSTNEELLTSKEELQSLNEELTALNGQLQETLERQRTTSNDLQNVLFSTDVATLFLDINLKIRFFTPATKSLFNVIPGDIGRPLADLKSLAIDNTLTTDARQVMLTQAPIEREIEADDTKWFIRRILPYRTLSGGAEGVVITFTDVSDRKQIAKALELAKGQAEIATIAKSRFLAAASHDLRQPLQTLVLLQGLLAKVVTGDKAGKLVVRFDETLGAMSGMLNALLDINKIAGGTVHAEMVTFPVNDLLDSMRTEFTYLAQAKRLRLRIVPCGQSVHTDPRLLEQIIRNLLSNALKYTKRGKVLLACRQRPGSITIEVWDTGVGIPADQLDAIFEEYHQVDNAARERSRGLGLGLSIVQNLATLLGTKVRVRSQPGKGSVFGIELETVAIDPGDHDEREPQGPAPAANGTGQRAGHILVVEDDPEIRELLVTFLRDEGYATTAAPDGVAALVLVEQGGVEPDVILADYNLPKGMTGAQVTEQVRAKLDRKVPAIILTGDISNEAQREIEAEGGRQFNKPVKLQELSHAIRDLLAVPRTAPQAMAPLTLAANGRAAPVVFIVDDDDSVREAIRSVLETAGCTVEDYADCEAFLAAYTPGREACLLVDAYLPGMSGLQLLQRLQGAGDRLPAIMITGDSDVPIAVEAMKAGALDFVEKPVGADELLACIERALGQARDSSKLTAWRDDAGRQVAELTDRQREVMTMVVAGQPSKNIAADLGISQRTVENHRASIMKKMGAKSLPALARLALAAEWSGPDAAGAKPKVSGVV